MFSVAQKSNMCWQKIVPIVRKYMLCWLKKFCVVRKILWCRTKIKVGVQEFINVYRNGVPYINKMENDGMQYSADEYCI